MPLRLVSRRLVALVAVLALGAGSVLPAAASAPSADATGSTVQRASTTTSAPDGRVDGRSPATLDAVVSSGAAARQAPMVESAALGAAAPEVVVRSSAAVPAAPVIAEATMAPANRPAAGTAPRTAAAAYRGRNHVWIPSLGISRSIAFFPCDRSEPPGHKVYRWGCAGANNVYLFAHASSLFRPLHDLYVSGRLKKGLKVVYANGDGVVRTYSVAFWKVLAPDGDIGWAYAAQSRPSLTLQTCVGANSEKRLVVRLIAVG